MEKINIFLLVGFLLVGFISFILSFRKKKNLYSLSQAKEVENFTMKEAVHFFEQDNILSMLKNNDNLVAVVIKKELQNGKLNITCCLFNKEINKIYPTDNIINVITSNIDKDLAEQFGNEDMIVLQ